MFPNMNPPPTSLPTHPHAPAPSMLHPTSDMDWRFNSYMTVYMLEFPLMLSFNPAFLFSSFTFIKSLFISSSPSAIRVVSSAYLRLLIFLLEMLIPAWASSSLVFFMTYSAYKLNKQGDSTQPWHTPFQFGTSPLFHVWF